MSSVKVEMMNVNWLRTNGKFTENEKGETVLKEKSFCNLVSIITEPKNPAWFETKFVISLLMNYWQDYKIVIWKTHFFPYVIYMTSMILLITLSLSA